MIPQPDKLTDEQMESLRQWMPATGPFTHPMERIGYDRNIRRAAEPYGAHLIAALVEAGMLSPEQDPTVVLQELLKAARDA